MNRKLTKENALRLHHQMWADMQKMLGDNPNPDERKKFKKEWCEKYFPNEDIMCHCFLCEYDKNKRRKNDDDCKYCLIEWNTNSNGYPDCCEMIYYKPWDCYEFYHLAAPISKILALPEREVK